jgi:hypothetical protein
MFVLAKIRQPVKLINGKTAHIVALPVPTSRGIDLRRPPFRAAGKFPELRIKKSSKRTNAHNYLVA